MRMAVIGCGRMGTLHARKLAEMKDVDLVGVCDSDVAQAEFLGDKLGCDWFHRHGDLPALDAAVVATNPGSHGQVCDDLLNRVIHVLVEKPMAISEADARYMAETAEVNGLVLQVGHIERFNPVFKRMLVGIPFKIEADRHSPVSFRQFDVDVVLDLMIHDIDLVLSLAKTEVCKITGSGTRDIAVAELRFIDGSIATLRANRKAKTRSRVWNVNDDKHYLLGEYDALQDELRHFIDCVRNGEKPIVGGRDGAAALKIALEISRQIREME